MGMQWTDDEIEHLYRNYNFNLGIMELSPESAIISQLRPDKSFGGGGGSKAELGADLAQAEIDVKRVRACMRLMTNDEKDFIELRYFGDSDFKMIAGCIRCSESNVYKIRHSVIDKSRELLNKSAA